MTYITKGEQFWNEDHTEGYEVGRDVEIWYYAYPEDFKALGSATPAQYGVEMPKWLQEILCKAWGVEAYRSKAKGE